MGVSPTFIDRAKSIEVIQDSVLDLIDSGKIKIASGTSLTFSEEGQKKFYSNLDRYKKKIILRPQEISNNPEIIRRIGSIAMNNGDISCVVPMASHIDHTEHDVHIIVTEQGIADLRGLSPRERAETIINNCAHPEYKPKLKYYYQRALEKGGHLPHLIEKALSWHKRFLETGLMK